MTSYQFVLPLRIILMGVGPTKHPFFGLVSALLGPKTSDASRNIGFSGRKSPYLSNAAI